MTPPSGSVGQKQYDNACEQAAKNSRQGGHWDQTPRSVGSYGSKDSNLVGQITQMLRPAVCLAPIKERTRDTVGTVLSYW